LHTGKPLLAPIGYAACGTGRFLLTPEAPKFVHPRATNVHTERYHKLRIAIRILSSLPEKTRRKELGLLTAGLSSFMPCHKANNLDRG
jgi:hypothetical protein